MTTIPIEKIIGIITNRLYRPDQSEHCGSLLMNKKIDFDKQKQ